MQTGEMLFGDAPANQQASTNPFSQSANQEAVNMFDEAQTSQDVSFNQGPSDLFGENNVTSQTAETIEQQAGELFGNMSIGAQHTGHSSTDLFGGNAESNSISSNPFGSGQSSSNADIFGSSESNATADIFGGSQPSNQTSVLSSQPTNQGMADLFGSVVPANPASAQPSSAAPSQEGMDIFGGPIVQEVTTLVLPLSQHIAGLPPPCHMNTEPLPTDIYKYSHAHTPSNCL